MREINVSQITDVVEKLCIEANQHLPEDVKCAIKSCRACEDWEIAQGVLDKIIENYEIADEGMVPPRLIMWAMFFSVRRMISPLIRPL